MINMFYHWKTLFCRRGAIRVEHILEMIPTTSMVALSSKIKLETGTPAFSFLAVNAVIVSPFVLLSQTSSITSLESCTKETFLQQELYPYGQEHASGTCFLTPLLGAFLADAYWGRYWTNAVSSMAYFVEKLTYLDRAGQSNTTEGRA